jgi:hypothetical protein
MSKITSRNVGIHPAMTSRPPAHSLSAKLKSPARIIWRLSSGESLAEFALRFGFLAPRLLARAAPVCGPVRFREVR